MRSGSAMYESDNGSDHRARTVNAASKQARKPGFACITLLSNVGGVVRLFRRKKFSVLLLGAGSEQFA